MPITHLKHDAGTVFTGESVDHFALLAQRAAVKIELHGLKVRRGPVVWKQLAAHYGIRPATKQAMFDWLDAKVKALAPQQEHIQEG